jgi:hypothetical protein
MASRRESLENALRVLEEKSPQFRNPDYQPNPTEEEAYRQYLTIKEQASDAAVGEAFELFRGKREKDLNEADHILRSMGLAQVPKTDQASSADLGTLRRRNAPTPSRNSDPEVAKRRALVRSNPGLSASEMCEIFDRERVPPPSKYVMAGFKSWLQAYKDSNYKSKIQILVSKDRRNG